MIGQEAAKVPQRQWMRERLPRIGERVILYGSVTCLSLIFLIPLIWMVSTSLKAREQLFLYPPVWIPSPILWSNYVDALNSFLYALRNTLIAYSTWSRIWFQFVYRLRIQPLSVAGRDKPSWC